MMRRRRRRRRRRKKGRRWQIETGIVELEDRVGLLLSGS